MPVLKQYKGGDGYYIVTSYPGLGFARYLLGDEGVALLGDNGIGAGDWFSPALLQVLRRRGLAYTRRSGVTGAPKWTEEAPAGEAQSAVPLSLELSSDGWRLSVLLPEIPASMVKDLAGQSAADLLSRCTFVVDGTATVPATRLWPDGGGTTVEVEPHAARYAIEPHGAWPARWDLSNWAKGAEGLNPAGSVFLGEEGGRILLPRSKPMVQGETNLLVHRAPPGWTPDSVSHAPLPSRMEPAFLGPRQGWHAWSFRVPEEIDSTIEAWLAARGLSLERLAWRLRLASPPPIRYAADGTPIIALGAQVIVTAVPATETTGRAPTEVHLDQEGLRVGILQMSPLPPDEHERATGGPRERPAARSAHIDGARYLAFSPLAPGTYRLKAGPAGGRPLALSVSQDGAAHEDVAAQLQPLLVCVRANGAETCLDAFADSAGPHRVTLGADVPPTSLIVSCPVPVDLRWSLGNLRRHRLRVQPAEVPTALADDLRATVSGQERLIVSLDAGAFGRLVLHLMPPLLGENDSVAERASEHCTLPGTIAAQARWLMFAMARAATCGDADAVPLNAEVQKSLAAFAVGRLLRLLPTSRACRAVSCPT